VAHRCPPEFKELLIRCGVLPPLPGGPGATGATGAAGATGATGATGAAGATGAMGPAFGNVVQPGTGHVAAAGSFVDVCILPLALAQRFTGVVNFDAYASNPAFISFPQGIAGALYYLVAGRDSGGVYVMNTFAVIVPLTQAGLAVQAVAMVDGIHIQFEVTAGLPPGGVDVACDISGRSAP
jgi:hypothetical protein